MLFTTGFIFNFCLKFCKRCYATLSNLSSKYCERNLSIIFRENLWKQNTTIDLLKSQQEKVQNVKTTVDVQSSDNDVEAFQEKAQSKFNEESKTKVPEEKLLVLPWWMRIIVQDKIKT